MASELAQQTDNQLQPLSMAVALAVICSLDTSLDSYAVKFSHVILLVDRLS